MFGVVDLDNDVMEPGAFAESITRGTAAGGVLIFGQHDDRKAPLGRTLELREDAKGLFMKGQISDTAAGRDYRQLVKDGVLDQMSIGYIVQEYDVDADNVRHLRKVDLMEISIVNYPANTEAKIESYKRWFRFKMARHETVNVLGTDYELQSVSPQWYFEQNDKCGMTGSGSRDTARYMDIMFKNVVTAPANVASKGLKAFEENEDIETPELLIREIERFLRPGKKSGSGAAPGDKK